MSGERRVRVVVWLDPSVLERLELLVRYKPDGPRSRSAVVREACAWLMAREVVSLCRYEACEQERERRAALDAAPSPVERERLAGEELVERALRIARERGP